jgi:hypothetical protein
MSRPASWIMSRPIARPMVGANGRGQWSGPMVGANGWGRRRGAASPATAQERRPRCGSGSCRVPRCPSLIARQSCRWRGGTRRSNTLGSMPGNPQELANLAPHHLQPATGAVGRGTRSPGRVRGPISGGASPATVVCRRAPCQSPASALPAPCQSPARALPEPCQSPARAMGECASMTRSLRAIEFGRMT